MSATPEERLRSLILKYLDRSLTEEESRELNDLGSASPEIWLLIAQLEDDESLGGELQLQGNIDTPRALAQVWTHIDERETSRTRRRLLRNWGIAAMAVILVAAGGGGYYLWNQRQPAKGSSPVAATVSDIAPGSNKGILTLADGSEIRLDKQPTGALPQQGDTKVSKPDSGWVVYSTQGKEAGKYNTLTVPPAGQYAVVLPDGTKVWLNNSSRLRYPTAFTGGIRNVTLTGEAYFEVARDLAKPFIVTVNDLRVEVLGTHFNVTAYSDEKKISTTLLSGEVRLVSGDRRQVLQPGQEAVSEGHGGDFQVNKVDTGEAVAWKDGFFHFDHAGLPEVLRQLTRWYDVTLELRGTMPDDLYSGDLSRYNSLSSILKNLNKEDVHLTLEGKRLIVSR